MLTDARKTPWYLDLTPSEMEAVIAAVPALLAVADAVTHLRVEGEPGQYYFCVKCDQERLDVHHAQWCPIGKLDAAHPGWREWMP